MGPGPRRQILLFGLDWDIQKQQDFGATIWGVVFLRKSYTDEAEEGYRSLPPEKQQEVKYGNNAAACFSALIHFGAYRHEPFFWDAISQGFSFAKDFMRDTVELLVEARRVGRRHPGKHRSDLLHLVDQWLDTLDGIYEPKRPYGSSLLGHERFKGLAKEFYKKIEQRPFLNAAKVPYDLPHWHTHPAHRRSSAGHEGENAVIGHGRSLHQAASTQGLDLARPRQEDRSPVSAGSPASPTTRKRSFSPSFSPPRGPARDPSAKRRRTDPLNSELQASSSIKADPQSPDRGPEKPSAPYTRISPSSQPAHAAQPVQPLLNEGEIFTEPGSIESNGKLASPVTQQTNHRSEQDHKISANDSQSIPEQAAGAYRVTPLLNSLGTPNPPIEVAAEETIKPTGNQSAEAVEKAQATTKYPTTGGDNSGNGHYIETDLDIIKEDVQALLRTTLTSMDAQTSLIDQVSELGERISKLDGRTMIQGTPAVVEAQAPSQSIYVDILQQQKEYFESLLKQQTEYYTATTRDIIRQQSEQFDSKIRDLTANVEKTISGSVTGLVRRVLDDAMRESVGKSLEQPFTDLKSHVTSQVTMALEKPEPRTWRLELVALEGDLKRHLYRIDKFYNKLDVQRVSSGTADYMSDLIISLKDVIKRAEEGQIG